MTGSTPTPRRSRRLPVPGLLVLGLFLGVAACQAPEPEAEPDVQPTVEVTEMEVAEVTVSLDPVNESGVSGEATAVHGTDEVMVVLEVTGLPGAGEFAAHIHSGSCAEGGGVAAPLNPVVATADGLGTSTTALDADALDHEESHFFQVHSRDGPPIACGDVDANVNN